MTSHAEKYRVAIFIENTVFAKSYSAQLTRSFGGASGGFRSPGSAIPRAAVEPLSAGLLEAAVIDFIGYTGLVSDHGGSGVNLRHPASCLNTYGDVAPE